MASPVSCVGSLETASLTHLLHALPISSLALDDFSLLSPPAPLPIAAATIPEGTPNTIPPPRPPPQSLHRLLQPPTCDQAGALQAPAPAPQLSRTCCCSIQNHSHQHADVWLLIPPSDCYQLLIESAKSS